jgi:hypothetical protein
MTAAAGAVADTVAPGCDAVGGGGALEHADITNNIMTNPCERSTGPTTQTVLDLIAAPRGVRPKASRYARTR